MCVISGKSSVYVSWHLHFSWNAFVHIMHSFLLLKGRWLLAISAVILEIQAPGSYCNSDLLQEGAMEMQ